MNKDKDDALGVIDDNGELPDALQHKGDLERLRAGRPMVVFLDFDGTLTPIVDTPDQAVLTEAMREVVEALSERCTVAVVSGRDRKDVEQRVDIDGLYYAGSHGFDIRGPGRGLAHPEAIQAGQELVAAAARLEQRLDSIPGAILEAKRFSIAAHYRMTDRAGAERVKAAVEETWSEAEGLRVRGGKKVLELQPDVDWDKGRAVEWLLDVLEIDPRKAFVVYIGDDETDEDAFQALAEWGVGIRVGQLSPSTAKYCLESPYHVRLFLQWLTSVLERA